MYIHTKVVYKTVLQETHVFSFSSHTRVCIALDNVCMCCVFVCVSHVCLCIRTCVRHHRGNALLQPRVLCPFPQLHKGTGFSTVEYQCTSVRESNAQLTRKFHSWKYLMFPLCAPVSFLSFLSLSTATTKPPGSLRPVWIPWTGSEVRRKSTSDQSRIWDTPPRAD